MDEHQDLGEMMLQWMTMSSPGEMHHVLRQQAGSWHTVMRIWGSRPAAEPVLTEGAAEISVILGGRFLLQKTQGTVMGQPMEGLGILGFDNFKSRYVSLWIDSLNTHALYSTGEGDPQGRKIQLLGRMDDPLSGARDLRVRSVLTMLSADEMLLESFVMLPDGTESLMMDVRYARARNPRSSF